jgi:hypothetical protein
MFQLQKNNYILIIFAVMENLTTYGNVDVEVRFQSGDRYCATLFTLENIKALMENYKTTGECNYGTYFSAFDLVIIDEISQQKIEDLVEYLIAEGELARTFEPLEPYVETNNEDEETD